MEKIDLDLLEMAQEEDNAVVEEIVESAEVVADADNVTATTTKTDDKDTTTITTSSEEEFDDSTPFTPRERQLLERLERVTGEKLDQGSVVPQVEHPTFTPRERSFVDENADIDELVGTKESINKLLLLVYNAALEDASKLSAENIMRGLPGTISQYVSQHVSMTETVKDFYAQNQDLVPVKKTVAAVANEVSAEHPDFTIEQVMREAAGRTRAILKIKRVEATKEPIKKKSTPAFAGQRSANGRVQVAELQGLAKEIDDLIS